MKKPKYNKAICQRGNYLILGKLYSDNSFQGLIELSADEYNIFQIKFLNGSDIAYTFLPECIEFLQILKEGIVGLSIVDLGEMLVKKGYKPV